MGPAGEPPGTTWRKLDEATKAGVADAASAKALMLSQASVIKRPVIERDGVVVLVGFAPGQPLRLSHAEAVTVIPRDNTSLCPPERAGCHRVYQVSTQAKQTHRPQRASRAAALTAQRGAADWFLIAMVGAVLLASVPDWGRSDGPLHLGQVTDIGVFLLFFLHGMGLSTDSLKTGASKWKLHCWCRPAPTSFSRSGGRAGAGGRALDFARPVDGLLLPGGLALHRPRRWR